MYICAGSSLELCRDSVRGFSRVGPRVDADAPAPPQRNAQPRRTVPSGRHGPLRHVTTNRLGLSVPQLRTLARRIGPNQKLAEQLWQAGIAVGIKDARILAALIGEPDLISRSTMDKWARDFDSWDVCDGCCCDLFDRTPYAWSRIAKWAPSRHEYVRCAAFSTLAAIAVHDKAAGDHVFLEALALIEKYSFDDRNFVRKAVNWARRNIGKRNPRLGIAAIACAERIRAQNSRAARWIAPYALRELRKKYPSRTALPGPE